MLLVTDSSELLKAIQQVKGNAVGFTTNFFAGPAQINEWIRSKILFSEIDQDAILIYRRDSGFLRIYHVAADVEAFAGLLEKMDTRGQTIVAELVGRPAEIARLALIYETNNFQTYRRLFRMSLLVDSTRHDFTKNPAIDFALPSEAWTVLELIEQYFDRYAEQIPEAREIQLAIERRNIMVVRHDGFIAGLLFFETQGVTSTLRYWLVVPQYRGAGVGGKLLRAFFNLCRNSRRLMLWVVEGNDSVIRSYQNAGFSAEGLVDQIVIYKGSDMK